MMNLNEAIRNLEEMSDHEHIRTSIRQEWFSAIVFLINWFDNEYLEKCNYIHELENKVQELDERIESLNRSAEETGHD